MKKLTQLTILLAFSIFANFVIAQKSPEEKTKIIVTKLTKKLVLTNEQQLKLNDIFLVHYNMICVTKLQFKDEEKELSNKAVKEQWIRTEQQLIMVLNDPQRLKYNEAKMKMYRNKMNRGNKPTDLKNAKNKKPIDVDVDQPIDEEAF